MKIALSCHALKNSGGIERYVLDLVRSMHDRAMRPAVFARQFDTALPEYGWVEPHPVHVGWLPGKLRDYAFAARLPGRLAAAGVDYTIGCNRVTAANMAICGGTHKGFLQASGRRPALTDRWQVALEQACYRRAERIVAHSQAMAREIETLYGIDPAKITVLYPPADGQRFTPATDAARRALRTEFALPDDRAVVLFSSTSHERKGYDLVAAAIAASDLPVTLLVAGRPVHSPSPNIRYVGYRNDIEKLFQVADFTVIASSYEPFGLVGVESVLCGTPLLVAANVGVSEVIDGPGKIMFSRDAAQGLSQALGTAVARWQRGAARLARPLDCIRYNPDPVAHLDALLALIF